jgi:hypothetical protein
MGNGCGNLHRDLDDFLTGNAGKRFPAAELGELVCRATYQVVLESGEWNLFGDLGYFAKETIVRLHEVEQEPRFTCRTFGQNPLGRRRRGG